MDHVWRGGEDPETPLETFQREIVKEETGLTDIKHFREYDIDETRYGITPKPTIGPVHFISARYDGNNRKLSLGEGAGYSLWSEPELDLLEGRSFPYVLEAIRDFYASLKS